MRLPANSHDFSNTLHAAANLGAHPGELAEIPSEQSSDFLFLNPDLGPIKIQK